MFLNSFHHSPWRQKGHKQLRVNLIDLFYFLGHRQPTFVPSNLLLVMTLYCASEKLCTVEAKCAFCPSLALPATGPCCAQGARGSV